LLVRPFVLLVHSFIPPAGRPLQAARARALQPRPHPLHPPPPPLGRSSARPTTSRPRCSSAGTAPKQTSGPAA
jgi:hypothetical protein